MPDRSDHPVTVEQWVDMFRAIGLGDAEMHRWHAEFEQRHPEGHQSFLEWLDIPAPRITEIRRDSGTVWGKST